MPIELKYLTGTDNALRVLETCREVFVSHGHKVEISEIALHEPNLPNFVKRNIYYKTNPMKQTILITLLLIATMSYSQTTNSNISETIITLEKGALEKWNQGDQSSRWNCTEVYRLEPNGEWKIVHTHWSSFAKPQ